MSEAYLYSKQVQYIRKGKWKNCQLQIEILKRCQDKLLAILCGGNEKSWNIKFSIYGYECNNFFVSLIGNSNIHRIKFETLESVSLLIELLTKYMKDVSYKFQLKSCSSSQDALSIDEWYMLHVQTNRVCLTTDFGNRLVAKWNRSVIGKFHIDDSSLNIEIVSKNGKISYSFFRDEKFPLEKTYKAIQNLKFEFPSQIPEKFALAPRRSGSIDVKRVGIWGNSKERIARERNSYFGRTCDSMSNDDSSYPSTPCSPPCSSVTSEQMKDYFYIDKNNKEIDELIFPIDAIEVSSITHGNGCKSNDYSSSIAADNPALENIDNNPRLVDLERCPYESERKIQGKRSPETISNTYPDSNQMHIINPNLHKHSRNSSCYQTMNSIEFKRKTWSEANFLHVKNEDHNTINTSRSAELSRNIHTIFTVSPSDIISQCSSPLIHVSPSNTIPRTPASLKSKDQQSSDSGFLDSNHIRITARRTSYSDSNHNYYNLQRTLEASECKESQRPSSPNHESIQRHLSHNYYNIMDNASTSTVMPPRSGLQLNYSTLCFTDYTVPLKSKKLPLPLNYTDIDHQKTEALKELDENITQNGLGSHKKKKSNILKYFKK